MPEYLAPGVYIEETSFRSKAIEGVSTTTTAFVGPTRYGPIDLDNEIVTSLEDFVRTYGGGEMLEHGGARIPNFMWHAARAFFLEGGKRLYVSRIFREKQSPANGEAADGVASATLPSGLAVKARYPGKAGNMRVRFTLTAGENVLSFGLDGRPRLGALADRDVVLIGDVLSPISSPPGAASFYITSIDAQGQVRFYASTSPGATALDLTSFGPSDGIEVRVVTVTVAVLPADAGAASVVYAGIPLDPDHQTAGGRDGLTHRFGTSAEDPAFARELAVVIGAGSNATGLSIAAALTAELTRYRDARRLSTPVDLPSAADGDRTFEVLLAGGNDGDRPESDDYLGAADPQSTRKTGLRQLEDLEEVSIVAAPGYTYLYSSRRGQVDQTTRYLLAHATEMRYRIAVLDSANGQTIGEVMKMRAQIDSSYGALYYPWVKVMDPITRAPIFLPPSGFVAGIYARNDVNRAVYKAPANEVVNLALGFEVLLNKAQQDLLNPAGVNCFRFFEGRGHRLWGARTTSSDSEWKYVNLRRYFAYLERSIDKGTQWAVFEPNGEMLWANVRRTIEDFLLQEWQSGALLGEKPEKAYFVRCDRSTMSQNDLDNGRLVCLVGVAALRPAEFVIFRIGQWTSDRRA